MASLALLVSIIILSIWATAALSLFSVLFILPHAPLLALFNIVAGIISIRRYFNKVKSPGT